MGRPLKNRNLGYYEFLIDEGYSHEEALNQMPDTEAEELQKYLDKSFIEWYFGIKDKTFYLLNAILILGIIVLDFFIF